MKENNGITMSDLYTSVEPCKKKIGFQAIPNKELELNLEDIVPKMLESLKEYEIQRKTKVVLVLKHSTKDYILSFFSSGRFLIRDMADSEEFSRTVKKIEEVVLEY